MGRTFHIPNTPIFQGKSHFNVLGYTASHSNMRLKVSRKLFNNTLEGELFFANVQYFAGPIRVSGVLQIGRSGDCLAILRQIAGYTAIPDDYLLQQFVLIEIVDDDKVVMRIVSQDITYEAVDSSI